MHPTSHLTPRCDHPIQRLLEFLSGEDVATQSVAAAYFRELAHLKREEGFATHIMNVPYLRAPLLDRLTFGLRSPNRDLQTNCAAALNAILGLCETERLGAQLRPHMGSLRANLVEAMSGAASLDIRKEMVTLLLVLISSAPESVAFFDQDGEAILSSIECLEREGLVDMNLLIQLLATFSNVKNSQMLTLLASTRGEQICKDVTASLKQDMRLAIIDDWIKLQNALLEKNQQLGEKIFEWNPDVFSLLDQVEHPLLARSSHVFRARLLSGYSRKMDRQLKELAKEGGDARGALLSLVYLASCKDDFGSILLCKEGAFRLIVQALARADVDTREESAWLLTKILSSVSSSEFCNAIKFDFKLLEEDLQEEERWRRGDSQQPTGNLLLKGIDAALSYGDNNLNIMMNLCVALRLIGSNTDGFKQSEKMAEGVVRCCFEILPFSNSLIQDNVISLLSQVLSNNGQILDSILELWSDKLIDLFVDGFVFARFAVDGEGVPLIGVFLMKYPQLGARMLQRRGGDLTLHVIEGLCSKDRWMRHYAIIILGLLLERQEAFANKYLFEKTTHQRIGEELIKFLNLNDIKRLKNVVFILKMLAEQRESAGFAQDVMNQTLWGDLLVKRLHEGIVHANLEVQHECTAALHALLAGGATSVSSKIKPYIDDLMEDLIVAMRRAIPPDTKAEMKRLHALLARYIVVGVLEQVVSKCVR